MRLRYFRIRVVVNTGGLTIYGEPSNEVLRPLDCGKLSAMKNLLILLCCTLSASAANFDRIIVFGDSLSDTGNFRLSNSILFPQPLYNYAVGRFTDGSGTRPSTDCYFGVWHEQLARILGLHSATASKLSGLNYAYADATTADRDESIDLTPSVSATIENLGSQVRDFLIHHRPHRRDLILLWAGANDLRDGTILPADSVANIDINLRRLIAAGARDFVVPNIPPLGDAPEARAGDPATAAALNSNVAAFNALLAADLTNLLAEYHAQGVQLLIVRPNIYGAFLRLDRHKSLYGLANVTGSAQDRKVDPDRYLFWDEVHPTTKGHNIVARYVASFLH